MKPNEPPWPELLWPDLQEGLLRFLDPTRQARQELREALAEFRAAVREQVVLARSLPREPREQQP